MLQKKDYHGILERFVNIDANNFSVEFNNSDFSNPRLSKKRTKLETTINLIMKIYKELSACQQYFEKIPTKAKQPNLIKQGSDAFKDVKTHMNPTSIISRMARKAFRLQALKKGFPLAGQINALTNKASAQQIRRVSDHLINPLSWTANRRLPMYYIIKGFRNLYYALRALAHGITNLPRRIIRSVSAPARTNPDYAITTANPDSANYNDEAFSFSRVLASLKQLSPADVMDDSSKKNVDAVQVLLESCDKQEALDRENEDSIGLTRTFVR